MTHYITEGEGPLFHTENIDLSKAITGPTGERSDALVGGPLPISGPVGAISKAPRIARFGLGGVQFFKSGSADVAGEVADAPATQDIISGIQRDIDDAVPDAPTIPTWVKGAMIILVLSIVASSFGQLFTFNVGGGSA